MIKEFLRSFFSVIRSPLLLVVAALGAFANITVLALLQEPLLVVVNDLLFNAESLQGPDAVLYAVNALGSDLWLLILAVWLSLVINAFIGLALARFAARQQLRKSEVVQSFFFALNRIFRVGIWALVLLLFGLFFAALLGIVLIAGNLHDAVLVILLLLYLLGALLSWMVVTLAWPISGIEDIGIREAFKKSGAVVRKHFFGFLVFMAGLLVLLSLINEAGVQLSGAFADENIVLLVALFFWTLQIVVAQLSVPFYYFANKPDA